MQYITCLFPTQRLKGIRVVHIVESSARIKGNHYDLNVN